MAKNQLYPEAKHITLTADQDYTSGSPVAIGAVRGVAIIDAHEGDRVTIWSDGSWSLPVTGALTEGQVVYLNASGALTATAGDTAWGVSLVVMATGNVPAEFKPL
jgi:predicted RecA/RadA family phage recombinase